MEQPQRRGPLQHVFDILRNAREPIKKTRLMYAANLTHTVLFKYMPTLLDKGLLEEVPYVSEAGRRISQRTPYLYVITDKGKTLVELFEWTYDILGWNTPPILGEN